MRKCKSDLGKMVGVELSIPISYEVMRIQGYAHYLDYYSQFIE